MTLTDGYHHGILLCKVLQLHQEAGLLPRLAQSDSRRLGGFHAGQISPIPPRFDESNATFARADFESPDDAAGHLHQGMPKLVIESEGLTLT
jgi:hypothetical protein